VGREERENVVTTLGSRVEGATNWAENEYYK